MTTALYRRYRPETFQDVIGQSHVTDPLMTALRKNKVNHAYLFSGPRGCGKTTSARILARCLNCVEGPTPTPCGRCESCVDLSRDGAGSLDVIEMDAASHGGVDDARQLRERATFAPVRDRYKIFIIDEAHMVTRDGFNALLKIVEEPPEHIKFIFATTEPNKVLPTIRSRTHHYPFRLVPPEPLMDYLQQLSDQESVGVEPGVLAMVVRAGGGSVRDSLSVLDQLMAGTDSDSVTYDLAVSLLGYTHGALLDDVVDAFASGDAATVFRAVDRVIQTGQDPRRFVEDLLERFRDLVIVDAVPESAANILHGMPEDQVARLRNQAQLMGAAELSRAADITNEALTEMTGATSPQLHLELLCARLLLPSAENTTRGAGARIDRLERRLNMGRTGAPTGPLMGVEPQSSAAHDDDASASRAPTSPAPQASQATAGAGWADDSWEDHAPSNRQRSTAAPRHGSASPVRVPSSGTSPAESGPDVEQSGATETTGQSAHRTPQSSPGENQERSNSGDPQIRQTAPLREERKESRPVPQSQTGSGDAAAPHADPSSAQGPSSGGGIDMIRGSWTEIVNTLADIHRVSWMTVMRATPVAFDGSVLQVVFDAAGDRKNFPRFEPNLVAAIQQVLGVSCRVEAVGPGEGGSRPSGGPEGGSKPPRNSPAPSGDPARSSGPASEPGPASESGPVPESGSVRASVPESGPDSARSGEAADNARAPRGERPSGGHRVAASRRSDQEERQQSSVQAHQPEQDDAVDSWVVATIPSGDGSAADSSRSDEAEDQPDAPEVFSPSAPAKPAAQVGDTAQESAPAPEAPARAHASSETTSGGAQPSSNGASPGATPSKTEPTPKAPNRRPGPAPQAPSEPQDVSDPPASPYDDIPWPDEPPPEDEPPVADSHGQGRPSRATAPRTPTAAATQQQATDDQLPPEQWRPSSSSGHASTTKATPAKAPAPSRKPSFRERHAAQIEAARADSAHSPNRGGTALATDTTESSDEDFVPSEDDVAVENSGLQGRAMIEKILGGRLVEERPHQPLL
ncbi:DNA polymerase III subunit gamma and tau [Kocuria sp.]|uniref:DNA polymerase III subunit gamma and tau n=1 Tax=Kocuria sp. TaxID=1871328 RepID=UPI0026E11044|nr:DNA polymerase III subunit gamma and tau [Kocuria sp.]MDO5619250.1 DNA polymerase III subunit gamma and tau [Kocuria sp.]